MMCVDNDCSSLIMHTDPDLPPGWRRKVVKRMKDNRYDVYIFSPKGKRFRSKKQLKEFLDNNERLNLDMGQFSFSLTKDKHGPKHKLTKLKRTLKKCVSQQKCEYYPNDKSASPASPIPPTESLFKNSTPQNTIILQPWFNFMIRVFSVPPVDQGDVSNGEEAVKDFENVKQKSQPVDVKNFVRKEALKTLLSIRESEKDDVSAVLMNTDSEERPLTELEELDLYYDFDYDKDEDKSNTKEFDVRRVFDSDSEDEDEMII